MCKGSLCFTSSPTFAICFLFDNSHLMGVRCYLIVVFICISQRLVTLYIFSCTCWPSVCILWKNCLFRSSAQFLIRLLMYLFDVELYESLFIWDINPLGYIVCKYLLLFSRLSILSIVSFAVQKLFGLM